jgi:hypothetical protein
MNDSADQMFTRTTLADVVLDTARRFRTRAEERGERLTVTDCWTVTFNTNGFSELFDALGQFSCIIEATKAQITTNSILKEVNKNRVLSVLGGLETIITPQNFQQNYFNIKSVVEDQNLAPLDVAADFLRDTNAIGVPNEKIVSDILTMLVDIDSELEKSEIPQEIRILISKRVESLRRLLERIWLLEPDGLVDAAGQLVAISAITQIQAQSAGLSERAQASLQRVSGKTVEILDWIGRGTLLWEAWSNAPQLTQGARLLLKAFGG